MQKNTTPKVLVLAQNKIQPFTGGGVVLSNLFGQFPVDKILFFHRDREYGSTTAYQERKLVWRWLRADISAMVMILLRWVIEGLFHKKKACLKDLRHLLVQACYFYFPKDIDELVRIFQPDVLYCWASDSLWAETAYRVAGRYKLPYVIHFMDNHFGARRDTASECAAYPLFQKRLNRLVKNAVTLYTISNSMGDAYERVWNKPYEVFHGVLDASTWPLPNPYPKSKDGFRIVFTGSIEHGQLVGLKDVAEVIERLYRKGKDIYLELYLTDKYMQSVKPVLSAYQCVKYYPHPDFASLRKELANADLLILTYGFDQRTINYYRHSFATKIVPYMLSGRAILVYGPSEIEPVNYARRGGWAKVVDNADLKRLTREIEILMDDADLRERLAQSAWNAAKKENDLTMNAQRFRKSLLRAAACRNNK